MLIHRSQFLLTITKEICDTIYSILKAIPLPTEMKQYFFPKLDSTTSTEKERNYVLWKLRECKRLVEIGNRVGMVGLVFGEWISHDITARYSEPDFEKFLTLFQDQRSWLFEKLNIHWPDAPALLKIVGGIFLLL
jgi:hypothetical protein